jgi:hypothetical protein
MIMSRKLRFLSSLLIGAAVAMFLGPSTALARGGGGGGGGRGGGGGWGGGGGSFHGGGFGGYGGGVHSFGGYNGGAIHSFSGYSHAPGASAWSGGLNRGSFVGRAGEINSGAWRHTQNWNDWGHGGEFAHDHGFGYWGRGFYPGWYGWYGGWGWPYVGLGWYGYGGWPYYGYGHGYGDYGDYGYTPYYGSTVAYDNTPAVAAETPTEATAEESSTEPSPEYFAQAREMFESGNYKEALRLAGHAAVDSPRNPEVHELASLCLFALKDYRGAAMEAHAALAVGPPIDWPTLYSYYGNIDTYTNQLRALEKFVQDNPKAPEGHFLLGYQFVMLGHKDAAKKQLDQAVALTPRDKLAERMIKRL